uniref:Histone H3 n=1 Tax=Globodera rostochiensis TaxID=31243 RepID=A0A914HNP2_GLORO
MHVLGAETPGPKRRGRNAGAETSGPKRRGRNAGAETPGPKRRGRNAGAETTCSQGSQLVETEVGLVETEV